MAGYLVGAVRDHTHFGMPKEVRVGLWLSLKAYEENVDYTRGGGGDMGRLSQGTKSPLYLWSGISSCAPRDSRPGFFQETISPAVWSPGWAVVGWSRCNGSVQNLPPCDARLLMSSSTSLSASIAKATMFAGLSPPRPVFKSLARASFSPTTARATYPLRGSRELACGWDRRHDSSKTHGCPFAVCLEAVGPAVPLSATA